MGNVCGRCRRNPNYCECGYQGGVISLQKAQSDIAYELALEKCGVKVTQASPFSWLSSKLKSTFNLV